MNEQGRWLAGLNVFIGMEINYSAISCIYSNATAVGLYRGTALPEEKITSLTGIIMLCVGARPKLIPVAFLST